MSAWRGKLLAGLAALYSPGSPGSRAKSCAIQEAGFLDALLKPGGARAAIDVTPESFAADNAQNQSDCVLNAEVRRVRIVFRGADGAILPRNGSAAVQVAVLSSNSSSFFKYSEDAQTGRIAEHAYSAPLGRRFDYQYLPANASGACPVNFTAVPLSPALARGAKHCEPSVPEQGYLRALARLPVFGRWEFALGSAGWPAGVERPVSATLMFDLASSCPSHASHALSTWSTNVTYSGGRSAKEAVPGSLCGVTARAETPPAPTPTMPQTTAPTYGSRGYSGNLAVAVGATSGAILVVAAALAAPYKHRQSSRAPTEPATLAAGT